MTTAAAKLGASDSSIDAEAAELLNEDLLWVRQFLGKLQPASPDAPATEAERRAQLRRVWRLSAAAHTDSLTGLRNRRGFMRDGHRVLSLASQHAISAAVAFLDVDGLKAVNDRAGHAAGDQLLVAAAEALAATFRRTDILGRIGGDEFAAVMLLPPPRSNDIRERLKRIVVRGNRSRGGPELRLSLGIAVYAPSTPLSLRMLLARADHAMYEERRARRE